MTPKKFPGRRKKFFSALALLRLLLAFSVLALFASFLLNGSGPGELFDAQLSAAAVRGGLAEGTVLFFLVAALVIGRAFCSIFCPMGTLQEVSWRVARRVAPGRKTRYIRPWRARYAVPLAAAIGVIAVIPPLMLAADPLSLFGRSLTVIRDLMRGGLSALTQSPLAVIASLAITLAIVAFAVLRGRRFCDWCPVGVALGCASRLAPFGATIDREACIACGRCERACPTNCVDVAERTVDRDRCVLCLSCVATCPNGSMRYGATHRSGATRRAFASDAFAKLAGLALGLTYFGARNLHRAGGALLSGGGSAAQAASGILPPGALSVENFTSRCITCGACAAVCPVHIIGTGDGPQPRLHYDVDFCQYNCTLCGDICPTAAIRQLPPDEKRRTRIADTELHLDRCIVLTHSQACGACAEVCPTRALVMEPHGGAESGLTIPVFDAQYCIGCGACLVACPAEPRAFTIEGLAVHERTEGIRPTSDAEGLPPLPTQLGEHGFPF